jgi:hypothetical protein
MIDRVLETMTYAGTIQSNILNEIREAYDNFDDDDFDLAPAKTIIKDFLVKHCRTVRHPQPEDDIREYKMSVYRDYGIVIELRNDGTISYLIDGNSGAVYVAEHVQNTTMFMAPVDIDFLIMMHQNSAATLPTRLLE